MRKRTRYSLLLMLALVSALVVAVWLRKTAPPEVARLLPESDAIVYANLKPLRLATHFDRTYETGLKVSTAEFKALQLTRHDVCPQWNYTIRPRPKITK